MDYFYLLLFKLKKAVQRQLDGSHILCGVLYD